MYGEDPTPSVSYSIVSSGFDWARFGNAHAVSFKSIQAWAALVSALLCTSIFGVFRFFVQRAGFANAATPQTHRPGLPTRFMRKVSNLQGWPMKNLVQRLFLPVRLFVSAVLVTATLPVLAQVASTAAAPRIGVEISGNAKTALPNSKLPRAQAQYDVGRVAASDPHGGGISIYFNRTVGQEAALKALMAAQQTPGSAQYHQWLTPEQFASQFGMADSDIAKVENWLEQQGFSIDSVARGKNVLRFTGTVGQVEAAFATESAQSYNVPTSKGVVKHFAPSTALSVPSAIAGVVEGVRNLDDFRPRSHAVKRGRVKPNFTQDLGEGFAVGFFAPGDIFPAV